ncbi:calcium-regulated heat stable protein 1 [Aplysia californica]|uniref:Calcium-regulated heat stable protein 1 n=1 Tax=Aplysia californica TaxID=6500 RepID=A0ABM0JNU5_APLCA|nr:calcium-regulated heat stable protein 1 [Aplysia californica]XP_035825585.1 calcium-regulated heat stable protein 1 [Aplysia californica]
MSSPQDIPETQARNNAQISNSPSAHGFLLPSPVPTRRTRTKSMSERAAEGPTYKGTVKMFCRQRGHGFLHPDDGEKADIFVHISDIEGEWVPKEGDQVTYKTVHIPPKMEKLQAVHVQITHLKPGVKHERWDSPTPASPEKYGSQ